MNQKEKSNAILWIEAAGFLFLIALSWLTELLQLPKYFFGGPSAPNWNLAVLRTVVILVIWLWVHVFTRRLLKRLHHLEGYLRICGWCRKVCHNDEWLDMEKYFNSKFSTRTSHGMCPECLRKKKEEIMNSR